MKDSALHRVFSLAFALCVAVSYCVAPFAVAYADEMDLPIELLDTTNYRVYSWLTSVTGSQLVDETHYNFLLTHSYDDYIKSYGDSPVYSESGEPVNVAAVVDRFRREYPSSYQAVAGGQGQTLDIEGFGNLSFVPIQGYGERAVRDAQNFYSRHYNGLDSSDVLFQPVVSYGDATIHSDSQFTYFETENGPSFAVLNYKSLARALVNAASNFLFVSYSNKQYIMFYTGSTSVSRVFLSGEGNTFTIQALQYVDSFSTSIQLFAYDITTGEMNTATRIPAFTLYNNYGQLGEKLSDTVISNNFVVVGGTDLTVNNGGTLDALSAPASGLSSSSPLVDFRENVANYDSDGAGDSFSQIVDSAGDINAPVFNIGPGGSADVVIGVPASTSDPLPQWDVAVQTLEQLANNVEDIGETGNAILWEVTGFHKDMNSAWHRLFIDSFEMLYEYLDTIAYLLKMPNVPSDPFTFDEPDNPATLGGLSALFESFMAYTPLAVIQSIRGQFMMVFESGSGSGPLTDTQLSYDYSLDVAGHDVDVHGDIAQMDADGTLQSATRAATSIAFILACAALIIRYTSFIHRVLG